MSLTDDPKDPCLEKGRKEEGQNSCYLILSDEERAKGFIRPVRESYQHIGKKIEKEIGEIISLEEALKDMSDWSKQHYTKENGYSGFIKYPESELPKTGRFITTEEHQAILDSKIRVGGCGTVTKMSLAIAETYARDPKFYGSTFCMHCNTHLPVNEFVWEGTDLEVGS